MPQTFFCLCRIDLHGLRMEPFLMRRKIEKALCVIIAGVFTPSSV
jgi:hypothetical protein